MTQVCTGCSEEKPLADFYVRKKGDVNHTAGKPLSSCKECCKASTKSRLERQLQLHRLKVYGLSPVKFDSILASQGGACAICRAIGVRWFVDHDHKTGVVRGILCRHCNSTLGFAKDSPVILRAAAEYLERSDA